MENKKKLAIVRLFPVSRGRTTWWRSWCDDHGQYTNEESTKTKAVKVAGQHTQEKHPGVRALVLS